MKSLANLPQRMPRNDREWAQFLQVLREMDIRYDGTDFKDGIQADEDGNVLVGDNAKIDSRTGTNLKTIVSRINDYGRAADQTMLPPVIKANMATAQKSLPLSGIDAGASIRIDIAAHSLATDTGDVAYNSGSIAGLSYNTRYFVYCEDSALAGGAVTYLATTAFADVVSSPDYYYVGTILTPATATTATITGATQANPVVITATNTFSNGDQVIITGIVGMGELNSRTFTVANATASNFELQGEDGTGYTAYSSGGIATLVVVPTTGGGGGGVGGGDSSWLPA